MSLIELTPAVGGRDIATWVSQSFLSSLFRILVFLMLSDPLEEVLCSLLE